RGSEREKWDAVELLDLDPRHAVREEVHRHARANAELLAHQEDLLHLVELLARDGEDDLVDRLRHLPVLEHALEIGNAAEDAVTRPAVRKMMTIGDEAEDFVAPIFVLFDHRGQIGGGAAGADD